MRAHQGKPFPKAFFSSSFVKKNHYLIWWTLCNYVDADPDGWIRIPRLALEKIHKGVHNGRETNITPIIRTLETYGFLKLIAHAPNRSFQIKDYEIFINDHAWDMESIPTRSCPLKDRGLRKLAALQKEQVDSDEEVES